MTIKSFSPHTRGEDERLITRVQKDFSAGMFADIPNTSIPENGVKHIRNFVNYGDRLVSRNGSREWGNLATSTRHADLPTYYTNIESTSIAYGTTRVITCVNYYKFTEESIGDWFIFDDGKCERIFEIISNNKIKTRTASTANIETVAGKLRHQINGTYFHKFKKVILLHIGDELYVASDVYITSWIKVYCESKEVIGDSLSSFDESDNNIIIDNENGKYKLDVSDITIPLYYYKMNSAIPIKQADLGTIGEYKRRYLVTLTKQKCVTYFSDRETYGNELKTESGSTSIDSNYQDYCQVTTSLPIGVDNGATFVNLELPDINETDGKETHWTHYSLWATCDVGSNGVDPVNGLGNNPELYTWVDDVPIMKCFTVTIEGSIGTVIEGQVTKNDIGSYIYSKNDVFNNITIMDVNEETDTVYFNTSNVENFGNTVISIGAYKNSRLISENGSITLYAGDTFTRNEIGQSLWLSDGRIIYISDIIDGKLITPEDITIETALTCCWSPSSRNYYDIVSDDIIRNRMAGYNLYQRLFVPIPSGSLGLVCNGFMFTSNIDSNYIYYTQIPYQYEYLGGYYHEQYQTIFVKDSIRSIYEFSDKIVVYCANSTVTIPINTTSEVNIPSIGVNITVVSGINVADNNIGVFDHGSICNVGHDKQMMITNEPAIRMFNGYNYSENIASQRIMSILKTFQPISCSIFVPYIGYIFWGSDE